MIQFTDLLTITLTLFAVIDILGNIPLMINIKQKTGNINAFKVTWISAMIMLIFLFIGEEILNLIGIDSPSIDMGKNSEFSVHHILAKNNILIVENLTNLEKIRSIIFHLITAPLKLKNATGSPIRAIALID